MEFVCNKCGKIINKEEVIVLSKDVLKFVHKKCYEEYKQEQENKSGWF